VAAAVLVVIGGIQEVMQAATHKVATLQGGVLVLDRLLMVLIIAEIAATRAVLVYHQIAAEPFLFIGLIASVRRILAATAAFEEPHSNQDLNRLLLELGALGLLIVGIAAAILMIRYSARHAAPTDGDDG
jgi:Phosphate-starvation-inducible E family